MEFYPARPWHLHSLTLSLSHKVFWARQRHSNSLTLSLSHTVFGRAPTASASYLSTAGGVGCGVHPERGRRAIATLPQRVRRGCGGFLRSPPRSHRTSASKISPLLWRGGKGVRLAVGCRYAPSRKHRTRPKCYQQPKSTGSKRTSSGWTLVDVVPTASPKSTSVHPARQRHFNIQPLNYLNLQPHSQFSDLLIHLII